MDYTSQLFHCTVDELYSRSRKREIVSARQVCMSAMRDFTDMSLYQIGTHFGHPSHSMVVYACQVVKNFYATEKGYRERVDKIYDALRRGDITVFNEPEFKDYMDEQMSIYADLV
jgi:chromosomal replication initiation ATPase DnaA